jgi:hypothetical protein
MTTKRKSTTGEKVYFGAGLVLGNIFTIIGLFVLSQILGVFN